MHKKITRRAFCSILLALPVPARAQRAKKIPLLGFLSGGDWAASGSNRSEAIWLALRERGYVEGKNIATEYRYAEGKYDRLPELAAELVRLRVDIIVVGGGFAPARAAMNATKTIPIVLAGRGSILSRQAWLTALPVPAATSPALQTLAVNYWGKGWSYSKKPFLNLPV